MIFVFLTICKISYAPAPSDYLPGPYNVTFTAGSTTATVDIPIVDDSVHEAIFGDKNFTAAISTIYPGGCSAKAVGTVTIYIKGNEGV